MKSISIIILTYDNLSYTKQCIESIRTYTPKDLYELIVVDNGSTDGTRQWLKKQEDISYVFAEENLGFPKGCNVGIQKACKENDLLLLNNDTIVTEHWLTRLQKALYKDPKIGAVGPICNQKENFQNGMYTFETYEEMQEVAKTFQDMEEPILEEKVFLIGFCLLIKREVMDKIGKLEEAYTPGYVEDNDLCLEIIKQGYHLMLCHNSFVYHYLGTSFHKDWDLFYQILFRNRKYFEQKWGFSTDVYEQTKSASWPFIKNPKKILVLNCHIGISILKLKFQWNQCTFHGVESKEFERKIAQNFAPVFSCIDEIKNETYDYILLGDLLEQEENPKQFLEKLEKHLLPGGYFVGEFHNASSFPILMPLLKDDFFYFKFHQKNFFTKSDIQKLFEPYKNGQIYSWYKPMEKEKKDLDENLYPYFQKHYNLTYYSFCFQKE